MSPLKVRLFGDKDRANELARLHLNRLLEEFRTLTSFQGLKQNQRRVEFVEGPYKGSVMTMQTVFGQELVDIHCVPVAGGVSRRAGARLPQSGRKQDRVEQLVPALFAWSGSTIVGAFIMAPSGFGSFVPLPNYPYGVTWSTDPYNPVLETPQPYPALIDGAVRVLRSSLKLDVNETSEDESETNTEERMYLGEAVRRTEDEYHSWYNDIDGVCLLDSPYQSIGWMSMTNISYWQRRSLGSAAWGGPYTYEVSTTTPPGRDAFETRVLLLGEEYAAATEQANEIPAYRETYNSTSAQVVTLSVGTIGSLTISSPPIAPEFATIAAALNDEITAQNAIYASGSNEYTATLASMGTVESVENQTETSAANVSAVVERIGETVRRGVIFSETSLEDTYQSTRAYTLSPNPTAINSEVIDDQRSTAWTCNYQRDTTEETHKILERAAAVTSDTYSAVKSLKYSANGASGTLASATLAFGGQFFVATSAYMRKGIALLDATLETADDYRYWYVFAAAGKSWVAEFGFGNDGIIGVPIEGLKVWDGGQCLLHITGKLPEREVANV